jgi:cutinase
MVVAAAIVVTPQAFAGTLPGWQRSSSSSTAKAGRFGLGGGFGSGGGLSGGGLGSGLSGGGLGGGLGGGGLGGGLGGGGLGGGGLGGGLGGGGLGSGLGGGGLGGGLGGGGLGGGLGGGGLGGGLGGGGLGGGLGGGGLGGGLGGGGLGGGLGGLGGGLGGGSGNAGGGTGTGKGGCADVELVFARGTGEPQGLGIVGSPLAQSLAKDLPGKSVSSFAVVYAAAADQSSAGPGATNMSQHIQSTAAKCKDTQFVIGGYSQGGTVTDLAMGIRAGFTAGQTIPAGLADRVAAVVVYGNPLGLQRQTIAGASRTFGSKAKEFCNAGDPVCGNGGNIAAHLAYASNGTVQQGAQFAAGKIKG